MGNIFHISTNVWETFEESWWSQEGVYPLKTEIQVGSKIWAIGLYIHLLKKKKLGRETNCYFYLTL